MLGSTRCEEFFGRWTGHVAPGGVAEQVETPLGDWVPDALERAAARVAKSAGQVTAGSTRPLHRFRVRAKRLRYLLECFRSLLDQTAVADWLAELERFQDDLGRLQDVSTQIELLEALAETRPRLRADRLWTRAIEERVAEDARLQAVLEAPVTAFGRQVSVRLAACLAPLRDA